MTGELNPYHPERETASYPDAGYVERSDGSVDVPGVWKITSRAFEKVGDKVHDVYRLAKIGPDGQIEATKGALAHKYDAWQARAAKQEQGESVITQRESMLFQPKEAYTPQAPGSELTYDHLFTDVAEDDERPNIESAARREAGPKEQDIQKALNTLWRALDNDPELHAIIDSYTQDAQGDIDLINVLRTNLALRVRIGRHFQEKLDKISHLPERVGRNASNNLKNPNFPGYTKMTSHEYVSVLALAMIDGSFVHAREAHDPIEKNQYQEVTLGQHRYSARKLLFGDSYH